jgi:hypothetical protein
MKRALYPIRTGFSAIKGRCHAPRAVAEPLRGVTAASGEWRINTLILINYSHCPVVVVVCALLASLSPGRYTTYSPPSGKPGAYPNVRRA